MQYGVDTVMQEVANVANQSLHNQSGIKEPLIRQLLTIY